MNECDLKILKLKQRIQSDLPLYSKDQINNLREIQINSLRKQAIEVVSVDDIENSKPILKRVKLEEIFTCQNLKFNFQNQEHSDEKNELNEEDSDNSIKIYWEGRNNESRIKNLYKFKGFR